MRRGRGVAEQGGQPGRHGLRAGEEALGAEDAGGGVDAPREGVHRDDVAGVLVPGTVFLPVGGGDFGPGVVEGVGGGEDTHGRRGWVVVWW